MAFKVTTQSRYEIDGPDAETLRDVCELARRHIDNRKRRDGEGAVSVDEYDVHRMKAILELMNRIFDR
jgi:hypothetical protein